MLGLDSQMSVSCTNAIHHSKEAVCFGHLQQLQGAFLEEAQRFIARLVSEAFAVCREALDQHVEAVWRNIFTPPVRRLDAGHGKWMNVCVMLRKGCFSNPCIGAKRCGRGGNTRVGILMEPHRRCF